MPKPSDLSQDLVPLSEFKTHASKLLRRLASNRRPLVITQHGRAAAIVLTPADFAGLHYEEFVRAKVERATDRARREPAVTAVELRKAVGRRLRPKA